MSRKTDEQLAVALSDDLIELGLTEYEARTLVTLVQIGTGTAKDIADADGVPRTRVYDAAETLQNMGLIDVQYATPQR